MLLALIAFEPLPKKPIQPEPLLGYNTWNAFYGDINEAKIKRTADLMVEKGLRDAGYEYIIIDDGYLLRDRDADGKIIIDSAKFPSGMKAIADYVHSKGLKFGMYNCAGTYTCMGLAGSFNHELTDAMTFKDFEIDFLKYDFCYNPLVGHHYAPDVYQVVAGYKTFNASDAKLSGNAYVENNIIRYIGNNEGEAAFELPVQIFGDAMSFKIRYTQTDEYRVLIVDVNGDRMPLLTKRVPQGYEYNEIEFQYYILGGEKYTLTIKNDFTDEDLAHYSYARMADALIVTERDIVFSVCEWGSNSPYKWAQDVGHMWRTSYDITAVSGSCDWNTIVRNYESAVTLFNYSGENSYNDPDMLCVGLEGITLNESLAHLSLWAMMNSPLEIGADLDKINAENLEALKNEHMLRINQDKLHIQAQPIYRTDTYDMLLRPLDDGTVAFLVFNKLDKEQRIWFNFDEMKLFFDLPLFDNVVIYRAYDIWEHTYYFYYEGEDTTLVYDIPPHGVGFFHVEPTV